MKVWITKYALTKGIFEAEGKEAGDGMFKSNANWASYFHGEGREWHKTRESAAAAAEQMRLKRIASLKKSLAEMEKLSFV